MKKRALKSAIVALEVVAIAIAIVAAALFFLYWRLGQGPVSLDIFKRSVEYSIEQRTPDDFGASIASIELLRADARDEYMLRLKDTRILDADNEVAAAAPEILLTFTLGDIFNGEIGPKTILADGASFRIIRRKNLNVDIPIVGKKTPKKKTTPRFSNIKNLPILKTAFSSASISNAKITFLDEASGRAWATENAEVNLTRDDEGLIASVLGAIDMDGQQASIDANANYRSTNGVVNVVVDGVNFPIGDILSTFYGDGAAFIDAPASGRAVIAFTASGNVLSSQFDAQIGEGYLEFAGDRRAISMIEWETGFDPIRNIFTIENLAYEVEGVSGALGGEVAVSFGDDIREPERISFDLETDETVLDLPGWLSTPMSLQSGKLVGQYLLAERRLTVRSLKVDVAELSADGSLSVVLPRRRDDGIKPSPGVIANIDIDGTLNPERLLAIWPMTIAMGARDWVVDRLKNATIENIDFSMNLVPGAVGPDGGLPDEAMALSFDAKNVRANYIKGMTPLTNGRGRGMLRGNSFLLEVDAARLGDIAITKGEVSFPVFIPKWEPTYYRFTAEGEASSMLSVLDEKPLSLLSKAEFKPSQFSGSAVAQVEIMRPNKRDVAPEEYEYKGLATFDDMQISELIGDTQISNAKGKVELATRSLTVSADAKLADDAPINLIWRKNFYLQDGPSSIKLTGEFDSSTGDLFGIASRQYLRGPVKFDAAATGEIGAFKQMDLSADFTNSALTFDALGWRKPAGTAASGKVSIDFTSDEITVDSLSINGPSVNVGGEIAFAPDGELLSASLKQFYLENAADLALTAERDATGVLALTAIGDFLNAGAFIETILSDAGGTGGGGFSWGKGIYVQARIDQIAMRNGVEYRVGALDLRRDAERLQELDFSAFDMNGTPIKANMTFTGAEEGSQRAIEAQTSQIGDLMRGVFGVESINGGEGIMKLALHSTGTPGFEGELEARNLTVVDTPLLARIFSAGSLDGLANLMNGAGIDFSYAYGKFDYGDGRLEVDSMRATGSSVGISAEGHIDIGADGHADLSGAVAPIYAINSALGNAPIIGDILVGKKGEGILAFSYRVSGEVGNPSVFVNPLSALTPGIFRQIFQPQNTDDVAPMAEQAPPPAPEPELDQVPENP
ncbi:AsmA-like C-terminal domain-containing protein [Hyphococcus sp. DH-69]|uniref:YhdP family protein n=1 Tax=Hyphococcus formosus TaxID=3143534 RepID=UPI00398B7B41